jgi:hypothetical protein
VVDVAEVVDTLASCEGGAGLTAGLTEFRGAGFMTGLEMSVEDGAVAVKGGGTLESVCLAINASACLKNSAVFIAASDTAVVSFYRRCDTMVGIRNPSVI